jgi:N-acetylglucosamine kinase-like BadF-type ATPase
MGVILGVDGGNSKTELVVATTEGECVAFLRGPGSNSHAIGAAGTAAVIDALVTESGVDLPAGNGVFFLSGADSPSDIADLEAEVEAAGWVNHARVDNDTFALLRAGTDARAAVAVICGSGINCVGRAGGRVVRYPSLGWETGDWGGSEMLGREAIFLAARAEDGRGEETRLVDVVRRHFGTATVEEVGIAVHYRRLEQSRLGELAPLIVAAAEHDRVAAALVDRLAGEIALLVRRAVRDLGMDACEVVLGGGMLRGEPGPLHARVSERLPDGVTPVILAALPVLGAGLAALDDAGSGESARNRLRGELCAREALGARLEKSTG